MIDRSSRSRPLETRRFEALLRVRSGARVRLRNADAGTRFGWQEQEARDKTHELKHELAELQYKLNVDRRFGLLIVLQAIDGGGKDSTVHHVMSAFNPGGCTVTSFKEPSESEQRHDYLWRVHQCVPARGEIAVFNRSHYEEVLIARVDRLVPRKVWSQRYAQINDFERMLVAADIRLLKFFLHISRDEQLRRFEERLRDPKKHWKFEPGDLRKRKQWSEYRHAFQDAISSCSTREAPWYVIPADHKWLRDLAISRIIYDTLRGLPLRFPAPQYDPRSIHLK